MTGRASRRFLLWLLAMLAGAAVVWHSRFSADMSFFLPAHPTPAQQVLVEQLKDGAVSRLLMLAIEGGDAPRRSALSRDLRQRLAADPAFVTVQNGETASLARDRELLFRHRYQLSPAVTPARFNEAGLRDAIGNSVDLLASPAGALLKPLLPRDPTGELLEIVLRLDAGTQPNSRDGIWVSRDGERAMLLIQTRAQGSDTDGQEAAIARIEEAFAAARQAMGEGAETRLQLSGPGLFAVKARALIKEEVGLLSAISTLAIVAVLFCVYRSARLLALGLLPVVSGALAGVVAVSLVYGTVFGITVGFGSALIGEAVDYAIYYFVQSGRQGSADWRARFWPTIRLGVLTSVAGFGALLFSGFPGLAQLGLYSLAGVLTAALVTRFVLPDLAGNVVLGRDLRPLGHWLRTQLQRLRPARWPLLLLAALAAITLISQRDTLWSPELSALSTIQPEDARRDMALRADIAAPDARYLVVVRGASRDAVLRQAEFAGERLDPLIATGQLGRYDSPSRLLPSRATQEARRASLPDRDTLQHRLAAAQADSPLPASRLAPFLDEIEAARQQPVLERAGLDGSSLAFVVDSLLLEQADGWSALLPLHPAAGQADLDAAALRQALAGSDALFIDMKDEFNALYNAYLQQAKSLSLAGVGAIVLLLALSLRSARRLAAVLFPLALAVVLVIAGLHGLGERLHLLHLIGMLLIVAVGSNYALFFDGAQGLDQLAPETLASMAIANLTTAIGFGTLGLSNVPVLHAIGVTVGPGAILALVLAGLFVPRETASR